MKRRRKKARGGFFTKKRLAIFGISLAVLTAAFFVVLGFGGIFVPSEDEVDTIEPVDRETGKINMLIVGLDKSESLTDTIMVASYNLDTDTVNILSVPRDTRMYIGSRYQKINSAYSISKRGKKNGINGTIEAVTRLTGIPINYYAEFTCEAFREVIDALGGVEFDVPQNMNYEDPVQDLYIHLKKGLQTLDGDKAEQLVRFRRYPMGDIDRVAVQQSFLKALAEQKLNASIILRLPELYKTVQSNLRTNLTLSDVTKYMANLSDLSSENIHMHALPGTANGTDYGSSYWIADMDELAALIRDSFGYDADGITIHSADGKSASQDVKKSTPAASTKPSASPKATPVPSESPKTTHTAQTPKPSATPDSEDETDDTPKNSAPPAETVKPITTPQAAKPSESPSASAPALKRPSANEADTSDE